MILEVTCDPESFLDVKTGIEAAGIPIQSADITNVAANNITLDFETARKVLRLLDALEEHDDVQGVASNIDIPDDVAAQLAAETG
jgi:transcriptional/translational regulatory protein YebC/TACO1